MQRSNTGNAGEEDSGVIPKIEAKEGEESNDALEGGNNKGNSGEGFRRRLKRRIIFWGILFLLGYHLLHRYYLAGFVSDIEIDPKTGETRIRKRPELHKKIVDGKEVLNTPYDGILEGYLHLVDIKIPDGTGLKLRSGGDSTQYHGVKAVFCQIQWHHQKNDPAGVPMFADVQDKSTLCTVTQEEYDLYEVAKEAREFDLQRHEDYLASLGDDQKGKIPQMEVHTERPDVNIPEFLQKLSKEQEEQAKKSVVKPGDKVNYVRSIPPTGVIFHESRCGSTLMANLLASFEPNNVKVFSEAKAPTKAIRVCDSHNHKLGIECSPQIHDQLIQDVFYLMGRTNSIKQPQYVFYKIQPIGVYSISAFERAMSKTPWVFLFRDSIEVIVSQLHQSHKRTHPNNNKVFDSTDHDVDGGGVKNVDLTEKLGLSVTPQCLTRYGQEDDKQPQLLKQIVHSKQRTIESLSEEEYCAAYLASLCVAALRAYPDENSEKISNGLYINYNLLPKIVWEDLLPHFGVEMTAQRVHNMERVAGFHSHGKGSKHAHTDWVDDSKTKQFKASQAYQDATALFLDKPYKQLQELSKMSYERLHQH